MTDLLRFTKNSIPGQYFLKEMIKNNRDETMLQMLCLGIVKKKEKLKRKLE